MAAATWLRDDFDNPKTDEAFAIYNAMSLAIDCGFRKGRIESDCAQVIKLIQEEHMQPRTYLGNVLIGIWKLKRHFIECRFGWVRRNCNKEAHMLA